MKLRCWPGCLAYVTDAEDQRTVGAVVHVISAVDDEVFGPSWLVEAQSELIGFRDDERVLSRRLIAPDICLRPITPPPEAESTDTREPIAAEA